MKRFFVLFSVATILMASTAIHAQTSTTNAATAPGLELKDSNRGVTFNAPNGLWSINAGQYSISMNHNSIFDAYVTMKSSWYTVANAQEAYNKRKDSLKSYLPGAIFLKENEALTLGGSTQAVSMTYKNPSDLKVIREIMFVHRGTPYELTFQVKEENFNSVKADFGLILQKMTLF